MSADLAIRLRALTQQYHNGGLNFTTYRSMRAALLDSLVGNGVTSAAAAAVAVTQPRTGTWRQSDAITRPGKPRAVPADSSEAQSTDEASEPRDAHDRPRGAAPTSCEGHGRDGAIPREITRAATGALDPGARDAGGGSRQASVPLVRTIAIAIGVLVIAGFGFWLWQRHASSSVDTSGAAPTAAEQDRMRDLLAQFTDRADWSDAHLAALNTDLLELGGAGMAAASSEIWFQRFAEEVRQRLKEQQALAAAPLTADNSPLAALAVTVGLDLNAPDAAIHIAALPAPRPPESAGTSPPPSVKAAAAAAAAVGAAQIAGTSRAAGRDGSSSEVATERVTAGAGGGVSARNAVGSDASTRDGENTGATASARGGANTGAGVGGRDGANAGAGVSARGGANTGTGANVRVASGTTAQAETHEGACRVELIGSRRPLCHDLLAAGAEGPPLALIAAGAFDMGSTAAPEEQPVHRVTIREPFAISVNEVSQGEFQRFCEHTGKACPPQPWSGDDYPVVNVSWDDARAYANWLSSVTHHHYALPTEAQWEYAARAGRTGLFPSGDALSPTDAQYSMLAKQTAAARRSQKFNANAFRLVHTVGNVREWVEDAWTQSFVGAPGDGSATTTASQPAQHVARGGSYADGAARLRLSMREGLPATTRDATTGFRIVRELP